MFSNTAATGGLHSFTAARKPSGFLLDKNATKPIVPAKRKGFEQLFREGGFRTDPVGVSMKLAPITGGCLIIGPIRSIRLSRRS